MLDMTYGRLEGLLRDYNIIKTGIEHNKIMVDSMELEIELGEVEDEESAKKIEELKLKIALDTNTIKMIDNLLNGLPEIERRSLELYYIKDWPWWKIEDELGYSGGWCKAKRNNAIEKMVSYW